jgi:hypothetical protein
MMQPTYRPGQRFHVQFVWQAPEGDFLRAVFEVEVLGIDPKLDRYLLRLERLVAGRQEAVDGTARPEGEVSKEHWALVGRIIGKKIYLAYEADDGRPLRLRFATLTGEHTLFSRLDDVDPASGDEG